MRSLSEIKAVFEKYKVHCDDGTDFLPKKVIPSALCELSINPVTTDLQGALADTMHSNGDGKISIKEFKSLYLSLYREHSVNPQTCVQSFLAIDKNQDGLLSRDELRDALCRNDQDTLTEEEFNALWAVVDKDGTGDITVVEWTIAMCPDVTMDELNIYLESYGFERTDAPTGATAGAVKPKEKKSPTPKKEKKEKTPLKSKKQQEEEAAAAEKKKQEEEEAKKAEEKKKEEAKAEEDRKKKEADQKKAEEDKKKREEEEARKKKKKEEDEEAKKKKEKEGGCCVVS